MTTVYFVRHAQSDASVQDPFLRPLTEQGLRDRRLVTEFLSGREVTALFSSPYKRAVDTLADFAEKRGLPVQTVEDFREHETISDSYPDEDYFPFIQKYWDDPAYKVPGDGMSVSWKRCWRRTRGRLWPSPPTAWPSPRSSISMTLPTDTRIFYPW